MKGVFLLFLFSRLFIFTVVALSSQLELHPERFGEDLLLHPYLTLSPSKISSSIWSVVYLGDASWYAQIAEDGYLKRGFTAEAPANWAFFPLLPLLERCLFFITGSYLFAGLLIALVSSLSCFLLLRALMIEMGYSEESIKRSILYLAFFPTSYFLNLPLTESLFLALTLGAFLMAEKERPILAGVLVGMASGCRAWGILIVPSLLILWWRKEGSLKSLFKPRYLLSLLVSPVGLVLFMLHLQQITGDPLAFINIQSAWGRESSGLLTLFSDFKPTRLVSDWNFVGLNILGVTLSVLTTLYFLYRRQPHFAVFLLLTTLTALNSGTTLSFHRYTITLFPIFIFLAEISRNKEIERVIFGLSIALLTAMSILLANHVTSAIA